MDLECNCLWWNSRTVWSSLFNSFWGVFSVIHFPEFFFFFQRYSLSRIVFTAMFFLEIHFPEFFSEKFIIQKLCCFFQRFILQKCFSHRFIFFKFFLFLSQRFTFQNFFFLRGLFSRIFFLEIHFPETFFPEIHFLSHCWM